MNKILNKISKQRISSLSYFGSLFPGRQDDETKFLEKLSEDFGRENYAIPIGRARMGIHLLAAIAIKGEKRRILMSPFTIPDVVNMVALAGAEPVFYDFDEFSTSANLDGLRALVDSRTAAILVTHYHINEPNLAEIRNIAHSVSAYLFDDCAISFGGSLNGKPVGTLTDASVFSFSSFKLINYFWGGLITTNNNDIARKISEIVAEWPRLSFLNYTSAIKACLRYDLATRPVPFNLGIFPLIRYRLKRSAESDGFEHIRIESEGIHSSLKSRPALGAFKEWSSKLGASRLLIERRREISVIYRNSLGRMMVGADTCEDVLNGSCFNNFPIVVPSASRTRLFRDLIISGFDVGKSLYPNCHQHPKFLNLAGYTTNVSQLVRSTIYLPTHFGVSDDYAHSLANRVSELLQSYSE